MIWLGVALWLAGVLVLGALVVRVVDRRNRRKWDRRRSVSDNEPGFAERPAGRRP